MLPGAVAVALSVAIAVAVAVGATTAVKGLKGQKGEIGTKMTEKRTEKKLEKSLRSRLETVFPLRCHLQLCGQAMHGSLMSSQLEKTLTAANVH